VVRLYASFMRLVPRLVCAMVVVAIIAGAPRVAGAETSPKPSRQEAFRAREAKRELPHVRKAYGHLREPKLPQGFLLVTAASGGVGVDLAWHRARDDAFVHLWQSRATSTLLGDKDPADPTTGTPINIEGETWVHNTINACELTTCLSRRFDNGDVVSLNGTLPFAQLRRIAASL